MFLVLPIILLLFVLLLIVGWPILRAVVPVMLRLACLLVAVVALFAGIAFFSRDVTHQAEFTDHYEFTYDTGSWGTGPHVVVHHEDGNEAEASSIDQWLRYLGINKPFIHVVPPVVVPPVPPVFHPVADTGSLDAKPSHDTHHTHDTDNLSIVIDNALKKAVEAAKEGKRIDVERFPGFLPRLARFLQGLKVTVDERREGKQLSGRAELQVQVRQRDAEVSDPPRIATVADVEPAPLGVQQPAVAEKPPAAKRPATLPEGQIALEPTHVVRPDWVDRNGRLNKTLQIAVSSGPWDSEEACEEALQVQLADKVSQLVREEFVEEASLVGGMISDPQLLDLETLGITPEYIRQEYCHPQYRWVETRQSSVGEMKVVHVLLEIDAGDYNDIRQRLHASYRRLQVRRVGLGGSGVVLVMGLLWMVLRRAVTLHEPAPPRVAAQHESIA